MRGETVGKTRLAGVLCLLGLAGLAVALASPSLACAVPAQLAIPAERVFGNAPPPLEAELALLSVPAVPAVQLTSLGERVEALRRLTRLLARNETTLLHVRERGSALGSRSGEGGWGVSAVGSWVPVQPVRQRHAVLWVRPGG